MQKKVRCPSLLGVVTVLRIEALAGGLRVRDARVEEGQRLGSAITLISVYSANRRWSATRPFMLFGHLALLAFEATLRSSNSFFVVLE